MSSRANNELGGIPVTNTGAGAPFTQHPVISQIEALVVRYREQLVWVHGIMFVFFLALLFLPLFLSEAPDNATALSHFTTFANYAIWGLWFPLVFISVVFSGRSWCGLLCPMGAASEWANKHGLRRAIPHWVRWPGTPVVSFLIITFLGQTVGVRDHPEAIAEVFGGTLVAAILLGYFYGRGKRAWCRHMCPIGLLLGVFSRLGALQFWPKRKQAGGDVYTEKGICPTMIDINRKEESRHCIACFRCVNPNAKGGLFTHMRRPGEEVELIRDHHPNISEVMFLFLGTGAALGGFLWLVLPFYNTLRQRVGEWFIEHGAYWIGESGPWWLMSVHPERREVFNWLDFIMIVGFMGLCMLTLALILAATTWIAAWLAGKNGADSDMRGRFIELGYQYAPVAMVSMVIGLGGEIFELLHYVGLEDEGIGYTKGILFIASLLWSAYLGDRILARQGSNKRWLPLVPGLAGSAMVGLAWWPAIFGV
jgi:polyferredoxin